MQIALFESNIEDRQSPEISARGIGQRRLIDEGMMHYEASLAGLSERYSRGKTSHTIHVWWARRPHSAMRGLAFASLCKDTSSAAVRTMAALGAQPVPTKEIVARAANMLTAQYSSAPKVLDMFGGGGTIPFEACRLGAETHACDVNELSCFVQKCMLEYSRTFDAGELPANIKDSGERILNQVKTESRALYPMRGSNIFGYFWTYSIECQQCGFRFFLSKRRWLSKKKGRNLALVFDNKKEDQSVSIEDLGDKSGRLSTAMGRSKATCPECGSLHENLSIIHCRDELVGLVGLNRSTGKHFLLPLDEALPEDGLLSQIETSVLEELGIDLPKSELPEWSGVVNPALYGMKTHSDFVNPRQRVVLLLLIKALREEYARLNQQKGETRAKCVIGFLAGLIDQVVDWNCRLSMWISQNEQVGRAFSGPGVPMLWDYVETDQLLSGPANLWSKLDRIVKATRSFPQFRAKARVVRAPAQNLPYGDETFDAIVTDPPYYDNIYYSILSDFFYAWKRPVLEILEPDSGWAKTTDFSNELVASSNRSGSAKKAHEDYCHELSKALLEAERVLKPDGVFSFIYSHNSLLGWEAIIRAYRATDFKITSAQPLSIERRQRPRSMTSEAKNTCIAFVARRCGQERNAISLPQLRADLKERFEGFGQQLVSLGWKEDDAGLAVFANCVGEIANASCVEGLKGVDALKAIADLVQENLPDFRLTDRGSL